MTEEKEKSTKCEGKPRSADIPNFPLHLTAARLRMLLNLKGAIWAAGLVFNKLTTPAACIASWPRLPLQMSSSSMT